MGTHVMCDRSGKIIPSQPQTTKPDLSIHCPWLPELDGFTFEDLCDEERLKVAAYLATIAKKSGADEKKRILAGALDYEGNPLVKAEEPSIPLALQEKGKPVEVTKDGLLKYKDGWYTDAGAGPYKTERGARKKSIKDMQAREAARG
jgi:hypothetical protein